MYFFRKLSSLNRQQTDVCEEAVSSALDDVLRGKTSTIFSYGTAAEGGQHEIDQQDMFDRILSDLFDHVYTMEASMEINIFIKHRQLFAKQVEHKTDEFTKEQGNVEEDTPNEYSLEHSEHFVASTKDVYKYMEKVIPKCIESPENLAASSQMQTVNPKAICNNNSHFMFTICVWQTNLERSMHLLGKLQLIQLKDLHLQEMRDLNTPMSGVLKLLSVLANITKTHLRYYNIGLARNLKDFLGADGTVIFNYATMPDVPLKEASTLGQHAQQLEQKNEMLSQLNKLLRKANKKVHWQRTGFQKKLLLFSELFKSLWQQQRSALQLHEHEREVQLLQMFETIYNELQSSKVKSD
ncbi:GH14056 [Drosophila grimshawi]|uniref:GH14056 n=1 Tax=Drosophila grimshawi TaxID=7222 RepID=B4JYA6_DROGR|nr:GH14056 [Drosophila grimshawi]